MLFAEAWTRYRAEYDKEILAEFLNDALFIDKRLNTDIDKHVIDMIFRAKKAQLMTLLSFSL